MRTRPLQIIILIATILAASCLPSFAWHHHGGGGVWIVGPRWVDPYPYPYPYPYYYNVPPTVVIQQQPDTYIQQAPDTRPQQTYWYYCPSPQGYYPYVKECPAGWMKVVPTPPSGTQAQPQQPDK